MMLKIIIKYESNEAKNVMGMKFSLFNRLFRNVKLKSKMTFVWLFNVAMILVCAIWGIGKTIQSYNDTLYTVMVDSMNYAIDNIQAKLDAYETLSETIFRDDLIQKKMNSVKERGWFYSGDYNQVRQKLQTEIEHYDYIDNVILLSETTDTILVKTSDESMDYGKIEKVLAAVTDTKGKPVWITDYGKESRFIMGRKINLIETLGQDVLGTLMIVIDIESMINNTWKFSQKEYSCVLVDEEGKALSSSDVFSEKEIAEIFSEASEQEFSIVSLNDQKYFSVYQKDKSGSWGYLYYTCYDEIFRNINLSFRSIAVVVALCVILIVILNSAFTREIRRGFDVLIREFQKFAENMSKESSGNLDYLQRKDEIGILYQQFDMTKKKVRQLISDNYVKELERRKMELQRKRAQVEMLETQISPHFLYNTLQTIDWRAKALRSREISEMIESLSQILQLTLSNKKSHITMEEELNLVEQFVIISQIRMGGKLSYHVSVEPELLEAVIPKLIIQPIVENGISYSTDTMLEEHIIYVEVVKKEKDIVIYVKNNGSSFPENLVQKLKNREILPTGHGIGILNIDTRIKLTYGNTYGVDFYNENNLAVAKMVIPFETEEERYV